ESLVPRLLPLAQSRPKPAPEFVPLGSATPPRTRCCRPPPAPPRRARRGNPRCRPRTPPPFPAACVHRGLVPYRRDKGNRAVATAAAALEEPSGHLRRNRKPL